MLRVAQAEAAPPIMNAFAPVPRSVRKTRSCTRRRPGWSWVNRLSLSGWHGRPKTGQALRLHLSLAAEVRARRHFSTSDILTFKGASFPRPNPVMYGEDPVKLKTVLIASAAVLSMAVGAVAEDYTVGNVMIGEPWARVTLKSRPAAAYMTLHNMGDAADKIVAASSPLAERVEMHTHSMTDGVMRMRKVEAIDLVPKGHTELKPGGLHLMIFGLKEQLKKGQVIPVTLTLKTAGKVEIKALVGGKAGGMDHSGHKQTQ